MVMLAALLTTPVMARSEGIAIQEPAEPQPQADVAVQIFVVGDGTPASCTKDAIQFELWAALAAGGGRVFFDCGPSPVTIPISTGEPLTFFDNTTIDGSGRITLQAVMVNSPSMVVAAAATVVMRNLTFTSNSMNTGVDNLGNLTVWECAFSGFPATAIRSTLSLNIIQSTFYNNGKFLSSPVIIQSGTGSVRRSIFFNNKSFAGGAINNGGTLDIASSRFIFNSADFPGGGAIANVGALTIENSEFGGNSGYAGGAVQNFGSLTATNTTFADNRAGGPGGGGIGSSGTMVIRNCDFLNNGQRGGAEGGALLVTGDVTIVGGTFSGNSVQGSPQSGRGGAIYTSANPLRISGSVIIGNRAPGDGGGIFVLSGSLVQDNNTFIDNFPNDIGPAASSTSTAAPSSTVDPEAWNTWRSEVLFALKASPQEIAARRAGPQTQQR